MRDSHYATRSPLNSNKTRSKKSYLFTTIIIVLVAFVAVFGYFYLTDKRGLEVFLRAQIGEEITTKIVFETYTVSFEDTLNEDFVNQIKEKLEVIEYNGKRRYEFVEKNGDIQYILSTAENTDNAYITSYLLPVGHFYWVKDGIETDSIEGATFLVSNSDYELSKALITKLGWTVKLEKTEDLATELAKSEDKIGLVRFDDLDFNYKLLTLDGKYFLDDGASGGIKYSIAMENSNVPDFIQESVSELTSGQQVNKNFTDDDFLKLNMTGVTALSRNLAFKIEASGNNDYAAELIGEFLQDADLTHTSNEVSFVEGCEPVRSMTFCSSPEYIEALKAIGADIIELTGNHNNDYGATYNASTVDMYTELGWDHFGGGKNAEDASKILYKEVDGTKIAFIGYNYYDTMQGTAAIATANRAGANEYSVEIMASDIAEAKAEGALVIVDFQFQECYSYPESDVIYPLCYRPLKSPDQAKVFRQAIDFGADIVVGTQAHQPQTYEIYEGKPIFYGLGNLFFDQIPWIGTRQGLILTHYFYEGKHVQTKITTTIYDNDMRPYVTEGEDRLLLLELLDEARP